MVHRHFFSVYLRGGGNPQAQNPNFQSSVSSSQSIGGSDSMLTNENFRPVEGGDTPGFGHNPYADSSDDGTDGGTDGGKGSPDGGKGGTDGGKGGKGGAKLGGYGSNINAHYQLEDIGEKVARGELSIEEGTMLGAEAFRELIIQVGQAPVYAEEAFSVLQYPKRKNPDIFCR